jgi:hypothetical protein
LPLATMRLRRVATGNAVLVTKLSVAQQGVGLAPQALVYETLSKGGCRGSPSRSSVAEALMDVGAGETNRLHGHSYGVAACSVLHDWRQDGTGAGSGHLFQYETKSASCSPGS